MPLPHGLRRKLSKIGESGPARPQQQPEEGQRQQEEDEIQALAKALARLPHLVEGLECLLHTTFLHLVAPLLRFLLQLPTSAAACEGICDSG